MAFVNRVADLAEATDHHPDIDIRYSKVTLTLSTHDAGGLTARDFDLAGRVQE
jgi:4a-hydroxytetrahydrobiopterin dehydratase